jgi:flavorubredoxin
MIPQTLPTTAQPIATDTWLIPTLAAEPSGLYFAAHSLVIRGEQPVIVDTGCSLVRDGWMEQAFSVVDPVDVRWVFLSHDDHDHVGNLDVVLERCPNATLVCNFSIVARLFGDVDLPLDRMRWLDVGESLDVGDRQLTAVRPPMFDSPATRGLYDSTTRLLWAVDSFGTFFPGEVYEASDIPVEIYDGSFAALNSWNTPWLEWIDAERFGVHLQSTATLPLDVVASAHGPVLRGDQITDAFRRTQDLVGQPVPPTPGQDVLDQLVATLLTPA